MDRITNQPELRPTLATRSQINILGLLIDNLALDEAVDQVAGWLEQRRANPYISPRWVVTANPEYVMAARHDPTFMSLVNTADLVTADGSGLIAASKILGRPFR